MKTAFRRTLLCAALALAASPVFAQSQEATPESPFSQTVFFGDSLTDAGYFRPLLVQMLGPNGAVIGQFTNNPGYVWSQYMADYFHSNASIAWHGTGVPPTFTALDNGNNWSAGGARVATDSVSALGYIPSLQSQYAAYLASGNTVDPNALYTVWGGANDIFAANDAYIAVLVGGGTPAQALAAAQAIIGAAATAQVGLIGALKTAGAQYVMVPTVPDIGLTPSAIASGPAGQAQATAMANGYNTAVFGGLATAGLNVIPVDTYHFLQEVVAHPNEFGLTNVTGVACLTQPPPAGSSSLFCSPASMVPGGQDYLFADGVHPTQIAHKALADLAISMVDGPRQIAVLPHSAATVGYARAREVGSVINGFSTKNEDGMSWWLNLRGDQQRFENTIGFDGNGATGSIGIGWRSDNFSYGLFGGYGQQNIDFGFRRGDFRQKDATLGGFIGWGGDAGLWANAQVSYTWLDYRVRRDVKLGNAVRSYDGSPNGENLSFGGGIGWNFRHGPWQHGPVVNVLWQNIKVDGYAENSVQSTALTFPNQRFHSTIASAGWQGSYAINDHLVPYASVTWNREFEDQPAQVWAQSNSMPNALPYAVPGLQFDQSYGMLMFGVRAKVLGLDVTTGSSLTFNQNGGGDASTFINFSGSF
ncbi:autotransporter domain-containing protein [Thermomonas sp.]|uniref:autotransporter domain-containing protein n=1 Tax=Thermomonas sp. TaxID=1971895 RepID=UPI001D2E0CCD|nr:autotransporter domain-containing protein [Thermomonas sp.]MBZ0086737.1 autotransporter domain-containing protein [Thermomonas sp.]MCO5054997.1 autotransporter domain-containing protein [Thermomonas sp.]HRO63537.1 autotransporter domain-containing protein [Thermomonas sp.]